MGISGTMLFTTNRFSPTGGGHDRQQDRRGHQDDARRRYAAAAVQQEQVDDRHQHPAVELRVRDRLGEGLGDVERRQHVAEQHRGGDEQERQNLDLLAPAVAEPAWIDAEARAPDLEDRPRHEERDEQASRHDAREEEPAERCRRRDAVEDAVEDEGDGGRDQDAERAARADRSGRHRVRVATLAHLSDAHLADRGTGRGRRSGQRGEKRAGPRKDTTLPVLVSVPSATPICSAS